MRTNPDQKYSLITFCFQSVLLPTNIGETQAGPLSTRFFEKEGLYARQTAGHGDSPAEPKLRLRQPKVCHMLITDGYVVERWAGLRTSSDPIHDHSAELIRGPVPIDG